MGAVDWWFRNRRTGAITIGQLPNPPLLVAIAAFVVRAVLDPQGTPGTVLGVLVVGGLAVWAAWELVDGVNPWRRLLGGVVLVVLAGQAIALLAG